jgi:hypothetical protein
MLPWNDSPCPLCISICRFGVRGGLSLSAINVSTKLIVAGLSVDVARLIITSHIVGHINADLTFRMIGVLNSHPDSITEASEASAREVRTDVLSCFRLETWIPY